MQSATNVFRLVKTAAKVCPGLMAADRAGQLLRHESYITDRLAFVQKLNDSLPRIAPRTFSC